MDYRPLPYLIILFISTFLFIVRKMSAHTRKVGSLGRYGPRIGRKLRDEMRKIEDQAKKNRCPSCNGRVKRKAAGIYRCRSCGETFTGGAYWTFEEARVRVKPEALSKPSEVDESLIDLEEDVEESSVAEESKEEDSSIMEGEK